MKSQAPNKRRPITKAVGTFILLFSVVLAMTFYYDFSNVNMGSLLFGIALLGCLFVSKNVYSNAKVAGTAEELKKTMVSDLALSSEELYIQLYQNSPVPYLIIDSEGIIKSANIAAVRMLGEKKTSVNGINVFSRLFCEEPGHLDFLIEKFKSKVTIGDEMVKVRRETLGEAWALLSLFNFTDSNGERVGLLTLVDITRQKRAEDAKSEFVSLASHQLRTPIAGMKWSAELLLMDNPETLNPRQRKYIDRLLISIRRMAILVDDFLRVSRFELGTFQAEYKEVNLVELFEDIIDEQSSRAEQKKLVIKTFFDDSVKDIISDTNLIRMIVINLYTNAIKYTRDNGTIHIGFTKKNDTVVITVADNGMGIPLEDKEQIFAKLFRASNAIRNVPDGTGLGLYILKSAVSVLKGSVSFTSTENMGTTFEVILPLEGVAESLEEDN